MKNSSADSNKWQNKPTITASPGDVKKKNATTANEAASTVAGATMTF